MGTNLVELVLRDHEYEVELFGRVQAAPTRHAREAALGELVALLVSHEAAESLVFYPAFNWFIADGDHVAQLRIEEHRSQEAMVARIQRLGPRHHARRNEC
jgi:hypothetical protein